MKNKKINDDIHHLSVFKKVMRWLILLIPYLIFLAKVALMFMDGYSQNIAFKLLTKFNMFPEKKDNTENFI